MSIKRPCAQPGCPELVRKGRCATHAKKTRQTYDKGRGSARVRGYDARWDALSIRYRRKHPLCEDCLDNQRTTVAALVHHVSPIENGGLMFDEANLRSLCVEDHQIIHAEMGR